jgi:hypothetical protein
VTVPSEEQRAAIDVQEKSLMRQLDWIKNIDTKVQLLTGINIIMIGAVAAMAPKKFDWIEVGYVIAGAVFLLISTYYSFWAMAPQMKGPEQSLIFFGAIAKRKVDGKKKTEPRSIEEFNQLLTDRSAGEYLQDLNEQVFINASIASVKYEYLGGAITWTKIGFPFWLIAIYMLYK